MSLKKNITILLGGTVLAQIFTFAISPILTRLYTPHDFGMLGTVLATSSIIAVIAHFRLNLAIALGETLQKAKMILATAFNLSIISCLVSGFILFFFSISGVGKEYGFYIILSIIFLSLLNAWIDIFNYWQSYRQRFKESARNAAVRSFITGGIQIVIGLFSSVGLVLGVILGSIFSFLLIIYDYYKNEENKISIGNKYNDYKGVVLEYKSFLLYSTPQGLLASISLNAAPLILGMKFGLAIAGQYWLAYRILLAPITLFGGAYRQVLHPIYSNINKTKKEKINLAKKHTFYFTLLFMPVIFLSFLFLDKFFEFVFGQEWLTAGVFSSWLVICFMVDIIKIPAVCLVYAFDYHKKFLAYELIVGVARVVVLILFGTYYSYLLTVQVFSIVSTVLSFIMIYLCLYFWAEDGVD